MHARRSSRWRRSITRCLFGTSPSAHERGGENAQREREETQRRGEERRRGEGTQRGRTGTGPVGSKVGREERRVFRCRYGEGECSGRESTAGTVPCLAAAGFSATGLLRFRRTFLPANWAATQLHALPSFGATAAAAKVASTLTGSSATSGADACAKCVLFSKVSAVQRQMQSDAEKLVTCDWDDEPLPLHPVNKR